MSQNLGGRTSIRREAASRPRRRQSTPGPHRHRLLTVAVATLGFPFVPLEFGLGRVGLGGPLVVAFIVLWVRYRSVPGGRGRGAVEVIGAAMLTWWILRLTVYEALGGGQPFWDAALRDGPTLLAALLAFSLAQKPELRTAITRGVIAAAVLLLAQEAYQLVVGVNVLRSFGYTAENEFFFYTESGAFRPFGSFVGPTSFGTFLAMVGIWSALVMHRRGLAAVMALATVVGVILTETRAAYIGIALALVAVVATSARLRRAATPVVVFGPLLLLAALFYRPSLFSGFFARAASATDVTDTSRVTRLDLWQGVVDVTAKHDATLVGMGAADWTDTMYPEVGGLVFTLGHAHSNFFQQWYLYGLIGATLFVLLVGALLGTALRSARASNVYGVAALAAVLVFIADSVFNNSLASANYTLMLFILVGVGCASRPASA